MGSAALTGQEQRAAALCHLSALGGFLIPFGHLLAPLAWWLWHRREDAQVGVHGRRAVEFQISVTIYALLAVLTGAGLALAAFLVVLILFDISQVVIVSIRTIRGEPDARYLLALPLLSR